MNESLLKAAHRAEQAGNLAEAARLYAAIVNANPRHFQALYRLAYLHFGAGRYDIAERLFEEAAKADAKFAGVHFARGCALQRLSRHRAAVEALGRALALEPGNAGALLNRGVSLLDLGRHEDALSDFEGALAIDPANTGALINRGVALLELKRYGEALSSLDAALAREPDRADALVNRGNALRGLGRREEAVAGYDRVLAREPGNIEALSNRGVALLEMKKYRQALDCFERALVLRPAHLQAWFNRGTALLEMKRTREAIASFDRVLALHPGHLDTIVNRANALAGERRFEEALAGFASALAADPSRRDALGNRAAVLFELGRYAEAMDDAETLVARDPERPYAKGMLARARVHCCDWRSLEEQRAEIAADIRSGKRAVQPFAYLSLGDSPEEQLLCAQIHARSEFPAMPPLWRGERYRHRKIRIAYLSADFCAHATAHLMAGVFEAHDRSRFETMAFSFGRDDGSGMRERLKRAFDGFADASNKGDAEVAALMREKEVDIAVDLKGYTQESRPGILSFRPAPVQVNYLGYPGTMGTETIDYILADRIVIPEEARAYYSEQVVYLPDSYQCNDATRRISERTPARAEAGLPESGFVFCSFNNCYKIMPEMFSLWMRLLAAVEGSVLWLLDDNGTATRNLRREAERRGVAGTRLYFAPRIAPEDHLARHRLAHLFLDTFPYGAHTTASDALWAGLPVVTCAGASFASRVAASLLQAVGLSELATNSLPEYEALALKLAREPETLSGVRAKLARNGKRAPLFDTARFARALESAYARMRDRAERGLPPESFAVPPPVL